MLEYAGAGQSTDFKYAMYDMSTIYVGARYTYQEMLGDEAFNFKLKTILQRYILTEVSADTTLESHFYYIKEDDYAYQVYDQLKVKLRVNVPVVKKGFGKKTDLIYQEKIMKLRELAALSPEEKKAQGIMIREIQISKLGLMTFTV
ncbi:MAG: hypothetical protein Q4C60_11625 [Eubacteriales bacterium]|nr:hypothetical protein [Eubacteriales bacterium]